MIPRNGQSVKIYVPDYGPGPTYDGKVTNPDNGNGGFTVNVTGMGTLTFARQAKNGKHACLTGGHQSYYIPA